MNLPKHPIHAALLAALTLPASAVVTIDYVTVSNAGNAADPLTGYGSVSYDYNIGTYEVTNAQYAEFLNAADPTGANPNGIYNSSMGSNARGGISYSAGAAAGFKYSAKANMGNKPVNYTSWYDAARFTNWMNNGQDNASTETGAYTLNSVFGEPAKNVGATIWIPSANEWYKAAYYDPTLGAGGGDNYWLYATQSNSVPTVAAASTTGDTSNSGTNVANYNSGADWNSQDGNVTTVGSSGALSASYYGTFDQGGNILEWNDSTPSSSFRGLQGGSWSGSAGNMQASGDGGNFSSGEFSTIGFRLASVPEPTSLVLALISAAALIRRRRLD